MREIDEMKLLGVTGGIGMGKSTIGTFIERQGCPVIDTDGLAREMVKPGQPALCEIQAAFGSQMIDAHGQLRRDELARLVFADPSARAQLESILHPRIREAWLREAGTWRQESRVIGAVIIPLLFETKAEGNFDAVVCVACTGDTQRRRLRERGWNELQIQQRIHAQLPIEKKLAASSFVIWNEGPFGVAEEQVQRILKNFTSE